MPVIDGIAAWARKPTMGSRLSVTEVGAVTVSVAALLIVLL